MSDYITAKVRYTEMRKSMEEASRRMSNDWATFRGWLFGKGKTIRKQTASEPPERWMADVCGLVDADDEWGIHLKEKWLAASKAYASAKSAEDEYFAGPMGKLYPLRDDDGSNVDTLNKFADFLAMFKERWEELEKQTTPRIWEQSNPTTASESRIIAQVAARLGIPPEPIGPTPTLREAYRAVEVMQKNVLARLLANLDHTMLGPTGLGAGNLPYIASATLKRGRPKKMEAAAKRMALLADVRENPSLKDDPKRLAKDHGITTKTAIKWTNEENALYLESRVNRPMNDDE